MFRLFQISVFIFFSSVLCAADFEKTYEAYQKGDYETALNGFFELAKGSNDLFLLLLNPPPARRTSRYRTRPLESAGQTRSYEFRPHVSDRVAFVP